ncbi:hypothetical protein DFJ73DRAFT_941434 [Zopfochytrium polystomum]|nr:hypothetical protein DFJ73DRAFT_941434 [Zopfochytrium polystomum]
MVDCSKKTRGRGGRTVGRTRKRFVQPDAPFHTFVHAVSVVDAIRESDVAALRRRRVPPPTPSPARPSSRPSTTARSATAASRSWTRDKFTSSELLQRAVQVGAAGQGFQQQSFSSTWTRSPDPRRSAQPIAGDDAEAKAAAATFVEDVGFDAVDFGSLAESWRSEPNTPVYVFPYFGQPPKGLSGAEREKWLWLGPGGTVVKVSDIRAPQQGDKR